MAAMVGIVAGFVAVLGTANLVGTNGSAESKGQSLLFIGVGLVVGFLVFRALDGG